MFFLVYRYAGGRGAYSKASRKGSSCFSILRLGENILDQSDYKTKLSIEAKAWFLKEQSRFLIKNILAIDNNNKWKKKRKIAIQMD